MAKWYVRTKSGELGPVNSARLAAMVAAGEVAITDLVRREDSPNWLPASQLQGLQFTLARPSPNTTSRARYGEAKLPPKVSSRSTTKTSNADRSKLAWFGRRSSLFLALSIFAIGTALIAYAYVARIHTSPEVDRTSALPIPQKVSATVPKPAQLVGASDFPRRTGESVLVAERKDNPGSQSERTNPNDGAKEVEKERASKTGSQIAFEELELWHFEVDRCPFVLNFTVIAQLEQRVYEISLPHQLNSPHAVLKTRDTVFTSKGKAQIAAVGKGTIRTKGNDGFDVEYPVYEEAMSETGAYALSVQDAQKAQEALWQKITESEVKLADALLLERYPGESVAALKKYLGVDVERALVNEELFEKSLGDVQLNVQKGRSRSLQPSETRPAGTNTSPSPDPETASPLVSVANVPESTNRSEIRFVKIIAGEFWMGSGPEDQPSEAAEKPRHRVKLTRDFFISAHEVTVKNFRRFVESTDYRTTAEKNGVGGWQANWSTSKGKRSPTCTWKNPGFAQTDNDPVVVVSWDDAAAFCRWLTMVEGAECRLPTEAEWEYACRAGSDDIRHVGAGQLTDFGWLSNNSGGKTHPVGLLKPNAWGLYDTYGNVREWCLDCYVASYPAAALAVDPTGPKNGAQRSWRGGSWQDGSSFVRSTKRAGYLPDEAFNNLGFRVVSLP